MKKFEKKLGVDQDLLNGFKKLAEVRSEVKSNLIKCLRLFLKD